MTEEKANVVAVVWETYLNAALAVKQYGRFEPKLFWETIHFGMI